MCRFKKLTVMKKQAGDAVQAGEGDLGTGKEAVTVEAETHQNNDSVSQSEPEAQQKRTGIATRRARSSLAGILRAGPL